MWQNSGNIHKKGKTNNKEVKKEKYYNFSLRYLIRKKKLVTVKKYYLVSIL